MELDYAWNQPQKAKGIESGKNTKEEDTYKEKTTWLA
jgi:hypothetical protein